MGSVNNSLLSAANTLTNTPVTSSNSSANSTTGSSSSSSSSGSSSSATNTTGIFTGTSAYSQDLQNVISRAVAIASMPISLLTNQQNAISAQSNELTTLNTDFTALQTAITGISTAMGGASYQSTSSAPAAVTATLGAGATEGVYNITVNSVGAAATSLSTAGWSQTSTLTSGQTATYGLVVGNQEYSVTTSDNSAQGVAAAIQHQYGNLVSALAVNVGGSETCISLQGTTLGAAKLNILQVPSSATPTSLQTPNTAGYAVSQTTTTWSSGAGTYNLVVNGNSYSLSPTTNSAQDVARAINITAAAQGLNVNAAVVNVGTSSNPDNRIELAGTTAAVTSVNIQNASGTNLQTAATSLTTNTWNTTADAAGTQSLYTLDVGANTYNFTVGGDNSTTNVNSAQNVAAAINSQFGTMVNATVVDLGTGGNHDCRIALQDETGTNPTLNIQQTTATSLQTQQVGGAPASYSLDGAASATSDTASINVATGVTLNLLGTNANTAGTPQPVSVTVTQSSSAISTALSTFANAYNTCVDEIDNQRGQSAGPLQGTSILSELSQTLSSLSTYGSSSGSINTLHDLGLDFDVNGQHLIYTPLNFMQNSFSNSAGIDAFLGSAPDNGAISGVVSAGSGFLGLATNALIALEDPTAGLLKNAETDLTSQITDIGTQISTKQAQVDTLQTTLTAQMAAADAAIATMEQQYSYLSSMLAAQQTANQQYSGG
jgi:flagellar hook-associated protein 2